MSIEQTSQLCYFVIGDRLADVRFLVQKKTSGAVAQLGERMTGSHEAEGSIPFSSTKYYQALAAFQAAFSYLAWSEKWVKTSNFNHLLQAKCRQ